MRQPVDAIGGEGQDEVAAELARAADDGDGSQNTPPIRFSVCSMSASSVIHSML